MIRFDTDDTLDTDDTVDTVFRTTTLVKAQRF